MIFESIQYARQPDGNIVLLGDWPKHTKVVHELMQTASIGLGNGLFLFACHNSRAVYKQIGVDCEGVHLSLEREH